MVSLIGHLSPTAAGLKGIMENTNLKNQSKEVTYKPSGSSPRNRMGSVSIIDGSSDQARQLSTGRTLGRVKNHEKLRSSLFHTMTQVPDDCLPGKNYNVYECGPLNF